MLGSIIIDIGVTLGLASVGILGLDWLQRNVVEALGSELKADAEFQTGEGVKTNAGLRDSHNNAPVRTQETLS